MGLPEWTDKINEFRGINRLIGKGKHHGDADKVNDQGISGGPQRGGGIGSGSGSGSEKRAWTRFDGGEGGEEGGAAGRWEQAARGAQIFFLFVGICINAAMASTQKKWDVGPSGLVVLTFIVAIGALLVSIFMFVLPIIANRTGKLRGAQRGMSQLRPAFLLNVMHCLFLLIIAFVLTISSNVRGCKDASKDPNADKEGYTDVLPTFCRNKRALTAFMWFSFLAWMVTLGFVIKQWKSTRSSGKIPSFTPPREDEENEAKHSQEDLESAIGQRYDAVPGNEEYAPSPSPYGVGGFGGAPAASRPSGTYYAAGRPFDDAPPTGYGYGTSPYATPYQASPAYEDPYERIRRERQG